MQLGGKQADDMPEADIPLTTVRTASSTGARQPKLSFGAAMSNYGDTEKRELLNHGPAARRRGPQSRDQRRRRRNTLGEEVDLNAMGRIYHKIVGYSVVTRYLVFIAPIAILLAVPIFLLPLTGNRHTIWVGGSFVDANKERHDGPPLFLLFVWIEVSWCSLWVGKLVAHLLAPIFMFFCGVVSTGTRKYATVIRALEIPISLFFWALTSWLVFKFLFTDDAFQWINAIKNILGALFVSSAIFLGEKTIVQLISITYHQRSFANRIKDSKREIFLLGLMYDASRTLFPMYCPEFAEDDYIINDSLEMILGGGKRGHRRAGSATPLKLIGGVGRIGGKMASAFGNIASEITGKRVFNTNSAHSIVLEALEKVRISEALARRIWVSFVIEGQDSLSLDDIEEVLGDSHKDDAEECFAAMDADGNGDISLDEMVRRVVEIGKERKAIANSMKDIGQALAVFDSILLFIVLLLVVFVFLAFFQSTFITTLATAGTALLSLSFVFAVTTQEFLGSCIFLFVKHPYDVGDRVDIIGTAANSSLIVEKISLLYTVFKRLDNQQILQVPNIILNGLFIENCTRSKSMREIISVNVSYDTSFEAIELLRLELEKFVRQPDNARDFQSDTVIWVDSVNNLDKLTLLVAIKHKSNWSNEAVRAARRSKFMCALTLALKRVPIYYPGGGYEILGGPTNPTYTVSVTDDVAAANRNKAAKAKEAARMVPPAPPADDGDHAAAEQKAVDKLNTVPPAAAAADDWDYNNRNDDDHDDNNNDNTTLNSRGTSTNRRRDLDIDIEGVHADLLKRHSTRGRRKAGEGIPPNSLETAAGAHVVSVTQFDGRQQTWDVESQYGSNNPYAGSSQVSGSGAAAAGAGAGSSAAVSASGYDIALARQAQGSPYAAPGAPSSNSNLQPTRSASSAVSGARSRGQSVSRPGQPAFSAYPPMPQPRQ